MCVRGCEYERGTILPIVAALLPHPSVNRHPVSATDHGLIIRTPRAEVIFYSFIPTAAV